QKSAPAPANPRQRLFQKPPTETGSAAVSIDDFPLATKDDLNRQWWKHDRPVSLLDLAIPVEPSILDRAVPVSDEQADALQSHFANVNDVRRLEERQKGPGEPLTRNELHGYVETQLDELSKLGTERTILGANLGAPE